MVMALYWDDTLYLASVGDSTGIVASWNAKQQQATIVQSAVRHKPADPEERKRIEAAGGQVVQPMGDPSSRVVIPSPLGKFYDSALAMSRSMGDRDGKRPGFLTAEPSVLSWDLKQPYTSGQEQQQQQLFVVLSSDGVTDMIPTDQLLNQLGAALFSSTDQDLVQDVVQASLELASSNWLSQTGGR